MALARTHTLDWLGDAGADEAGECFIVASLSEMRSVFFPVSAVVSHRSGLPPGWPQDARGQRAGCTAHCQSRAAQRDTAACWAGVVRIALRIEGQPSPSQSVGV